MDRSILGLALLLAGCSPVEPPVRPARVTPQSFGSARSWVGDLASDGTHVYWANYDMSSGRSTHTVLDRLGVDGSGGQQLAVESHPPTQVEVFDGYLYWIYTLAPLKRIPVTGGEVQILRERGGGPCFDVDASGVYVIDNGHVLQIDLTTGAEREVAQDSFGDCPVVLGDQIYWTERKGIYRVPKAGGVPIKLVDTNKPSGLVVFEGALYSCLGGDTLTRVDPATGVTTPIRDFCRGDGLAVSSDAHWFRSPYFVGWPATEKWRVAEVTKQGPSWLFDGEGVSDLLLVGDDLVWFGRPHGGSPAWQGFKAPIR